MLDIYVLSKRIACSFASSDADNIIVGALRMTSCERYAWEDETKLTSLYVGRGVTRFSRSLDWCVRASQCALL